MHVAELDGKLLDYWVARAEAIAADDLIFRDKRCMQIMRGGPMGFSGFMVRDYSMNWALCGPILERDGIKVEPLSDACWLAEEAITAQQGKGPTAMIAICRAVVRAAFGDEVEDLP